MNLKGVLTMSLNEIQINNLSKLDVAEGGGIFRDSIKVAADDQATVIIGLGGLGCKTLDKLKGQIKSRVNKENNSIRLLAIDSADSDLEQLASHGNLTKDEVLSLYDPEIPAMMAAKPIPDFMRSWLNADFIPTVSGYGCNAIRQTGRFILSVPAVYNKVRNRVKELILEAWDTALMREINIIFIAGVSGGTGGGTFIDMAYLVQDVLKSDIGATRLGYIMSAFLYMPDVQFGSGANIDMLNINGYASLKELDYYMNMHRYDGVYEWPFVEGKIKNTKDKIFDFCTLVSPQYAAGGIVGKDAEKMAINVTVDSLMTLITNAEIVGRNGQNLQMLMSFGHACDPRRIEDWMDAGNGANIALFPRNVNYAYNVISYGTAKIPADEIMSYIALKMYENVLDEYHDMDDLNDDYISRLMWSVGAGDIEAIIYAVKDCSQCSYNPAELPPGGDIHLVKGSYVNWRDSTIEHYITYKNTQPFSKAIDRITKNIISSLDTKLDAAFGEKGPYFVSKLITATYEDDGADGILRKIDALIKVMSDEYDARIERCSTTDKLIAVLDQKAAEVPTILGIVRADDRYNYLYMSKATIERYTVEMEILARMRDKLYEVKDFLTDKNNKVYDVYTGVLDHIKDILAKNCESVLKSNRVAAYSFDAVNLDSSQTYGSRLKACLDTLLTPAFLAKFKDDFEEILRDPNNRPAFTDSTDKFDAAKLIQKLFDWLLDGFYQGAVERFLIASYFYLIIPNMDIDMLDSIMDDEAQKRPALQAAAHAIYIELELQHNVIKPLCQIDGAEIGQFADPIKFMCCPSVLYDAFSAMYLPNEATLCKRDNAFSVDVITCYPGIPLTKIRGISDAADAYERAISSNIKGLHLNENPASDFRAFPEPFIR